MKNQYNFKVTKLHNKLKVSVYFQKIPQHFYLSLKEARLFVVTLVGAIWGKK